MKGRRIRAVAFIFCFASLLALAFMIGSGLGEQTSNGYLHRGMIRNALACYDLAGWLHDLLAAFFIPVLLWAVGHFLGTVLKGRPRGLKLLWLLSVLVFLAALNFIFSRSNINTYKF